MTRLRSRAPAGALVTFVLMLSACGAGIESEGASRVATSVPDDDFEAWRVAESAVCDEFEPQVAARAREMDQPTSLQEAAVYFDTMTPLNDEYMVAVLTVPKPDTRRAEVTQLYALASELRVAAQDAQAAAHFDDEPSFREAVALLEARSDDANALLLQLDLPNCVSATVATPA